MEDSKNLVLAIDTSCLRGTLALGEIAHTRPGPLFGEASWQREKSHSELIIVELKKLLRETERQLEDLRAIAIGVGPGSFTGLRVGLNVARTLSYGLEIPLWPVTSLRIWAEPLLTDQRPVLVLVNAFRNLLYVALYQRRGEKVEELWPPRALTVEEVVASLPGGEVQIAGDGWSTFIEFWPADFKSRAQIFQTPWLEARDLLSIMVEGSPWCKDLPWQLVKPLYIRGSEAEEKLRRGLLKPLPRG